MTIPEAFYYLPLQSSHFVCFWEITTPALFASTIIFIYLWQSYLLIFPAIGITFLNLVVVAHHPQIKIGFDASASNMIMIMILIQLTRSGNVDDRSAIMIISTLPS